MPTIASQDLYLYAAIGILLLCSIITRCGFMLFGDYLPLPDGLRRALRYAPAAALTAIVVPDLLPWEPELGPIFDFRLAAGVVGVLAYLRYASAVLVIVGGMATLWALRWLAG
jgi:branched-subunit amino acid transport protein